MCQYVAKMEILHFVQRAQRENNPTKSMLLCEEPKKSAQDAEEKIEKAP